jgi:hypothetical protein
MVDSPFFRLPLELREQVYFHYVYEPTGYHHEATSGKLRCADGRPLDLALQYTCRSIAAEMSGLALQHNTITFTPFEDKRADYMDQLLDWQEHGYWYLLGQASTQFTYQVLHKLKELHPGNYTLEYILNAPSERLEDLVGAFLPYGSGQPCSITRAVWHDMIRLMTQTPDFTLKDGTEFNAARRALVEWQPPLWLLASHSELDDLRQTIFDRQAFSNTRRFIKFHFSATTAALTFLQSISESAHSQLRTIVLDDNRASVAHPETHAQGLIPYCRDNPNLRIDHRVSLWRTVVVHYSMLENFYNPMNSYVQYQPTACRAADSVMSWIGEALLLEVSGMPKSSYTMTLEGSPDLTQQIWDHLKRAAAAQEASLEMVRRGSMQLSNELFVNLGRPYLHKADELPRVVREMIQGTSCVRLDAFKGELWDIDEVIATETRIRVETWQQFFDRVELDQSELEHGPAGLLREFCVAPKPHRVPDTALENWEDPLEGCVMFLEEVS